MGLLELHASYDKVSHDAGIQSADDNEHRG